MKKTKNPIFFRYEFTDEKGTPEGGDIFELASMNDVQEMTTDILKVAHSDGVTVNLTIGEEVPFFGFLKKVGMTQQDIERERVDEELITGSSSKKKSSGKAPKKSGKKTAKKKTASSAKKKTKKKK